MYEFRLMFHWSLLLRVQLTILHPVLVQVMACCWPVDKPLSEPMVLSLLKDLCFTLPQRVNRRKPTFWGHKVSGQLETPMCEHIIGVELDQKLFIGAVDDLGRTDSAYFGDQVVCRCRRSRVEGHPIPVTVLLIFYVEIFNQNGSDLKVVNFVLPWYNTGLILGLRPANERRRYFVTTSLIGWAQT